MIRRPPRSTLFPYRRSSDLEIALALSHLDLLTAAADGIDLHHARAPGGRVGRGDRKSTRLNSSHLGSSYAVFCLKKKKSAPRLRPAQPRALPSLASRRSSSR